MDIRDSEPGDDGSRVNELAEWLAGLPDTQGPEDMARWFELLFSAPPSGPLWDSFKVRYVEASLERIAAARARDGRGSRANARQTLGFMTMTFLAGGRLELFDSFIEML